NEDLDYTATIIHGIKDSFMPDVAPVPGATIYGAQVSLVARRVDTTPVPVTLAPFVRQFGVDVVAAPVTLAATATYGYVTVPCAPPDVTHGQAWFSVLEFGYQRP